MGTSFTMIETKACNLPDSVPKGWRAYAYNSPDIVIGTDTIVKHNGKASGFLQIPQSVVLCTGQMIQSIAADPYRKKRVRLTVYLKSKEVEAGFIFMRVDGPDSAVAFANTLNEPIEETIDWTLYHITLDVLEESRNINFGAVLKGQGILWVDDFSLEVVDRSIPSDDKVATGLMLIKGWKVPKKNYLPNPVSMNLGFEDR